MNLKENPMTALKKFKKVPIYVVEEHNDALQFIYSAIGGKKLPIEGTTLLHLDAHPDMLIDRKLKGIEARSGRKVLSLLQIENWIVPAAAAGHIGRVVWLRPPWAKQFSDGTRVISVGDHPTNGLLRVDSKEPYYLSDALYSSQLLNKRNFTLSVAEVSSSEKEENIENLAHNLNISQPYILDIDLDFFSTGNPFLSLYDNIKLYDLLEPIFEFKVPDTDDSEVIDQAVAEREQHLQELENLFEHLEENNGLKNYKGPKTKHFKMVSELVDAVVSEAERLGEPADWWAVYAGGCTRDQGGLPYHISSDEEINNMVKNALIPLLKTLPPPVLVTVARSTEDGYCPSHQVDFIQSLVLQTLNEVYEAEEPFLHYLTANTS